MAPETEELRRAIERMEQEIQKAKELLQRLEQDDNLKLSPRPS